MMAPLVFSDRASSMIEFSVSGTRCPLISVGRFRAARAATVGTVPDRIRMIKP